MSIEEIRTAIIAFASSAIAYFFGRKQSKATLMKTEAEADQIRITTRIQREDHSQVESDKIMNKIEVLRNKVDAQDILIDGLKIENKNLRTQCDELKSELTLYKTIQS